MNIFMFSHSAIIRTTYIHLAAIIGNLGRETPSLSRWECEWGINTSCACCKSASGNYVLPMMTFKWMKAKEWLRRRTAPGNQLACTENGWQIWVKSVKLLKHFIYPIKQPKILLLGLDKRATHTHTHTHTHTNTHTRAHTHTHTHTHTYIP